MFCQLSPLWFSLLFRQLSQGTYGSLLALLGILGLGGVLSVAPPVLMLGVPSDGLIETLGEAGMDRLPAELVLELGGIDGIAAVMAGAVANPVEGVGRLTHALENGTKHVDVVLLAVGSDEVGLADAALGEDVPHGARVILGVDPVADVLAVAIEFGADATEDVGDLARDELLYVLIGTIVVGAVGDRGAHA